MDLDRNDRNLNPKPDPPALGRSGRSEGITGPGPITPFEDVGLSSLGLDLSNLPPDPVVAEYLGTGKRDGLAYRVSRYADSWAVTAWHLESGAQVGGVQTRKSLEAAKAFAESAALGRPGAGPLTAPGMVQVAEERVQEFISTGKPLHLRTVIDDPNSTPAMVRQALAIATLGVNLCLDVMEASIRFSREAGRPHPRAERHETNMGRMIRWQEALEDRLAAMWPAID